ncbi:MAG: PD-(D/E)XK nuclease family protein, partial [bacterium]
MIGRSWVTVAGLARRIRDDALDEWAVMPAEEAFWVVMQALRSVKTRKGPETLREYYRWARAGQSAINDLKQAQKSPGQVVALSRQAERKGDKALGERLRILAQLYGFYEDTLKREMKLDDIAAIRRAGDLIRRGAPKPASRLVLKGFFNFTPVQMELFESCRNSGIEMEYEPPFHPDCLNANTYERLATKIDHIGLTPSTIEAPILEKTAVRCPTIRDEFAFAAKSIKQRILKDGIHPWDAMVISRRLTHRVEEVAGIFEEYGLPVRVTGTMPLSHTPEVRFLLEVINVIDQGFPRRAVIQLLWHPFVVAGDWVQRARQVGELQSLTRQSKLLEGVEAWRQALQAKPDFSPLLRFIEALREVEAPAPLGKRLEWLKALAPPGYPDENRTGLNILIEQLSRIQNWSGKTSWTRGEFFDHVRQLGDEISVEINTSDKYGGKGVIEAAGVLVTTPEGAAGIHRACVAVVTLDEQEFPQAFEEAGGPGGLILTAGQREDCNLLAKRDLFLDASAHYENERRLFALCAGAATRWLVLSCNTYEGERERLPSSYWTEWQERESTKQEVVSRRTVLAPAPDEAWTKKQWGIAKAVARASSVTASGPLDEFSGYEGILHVPEALALTKEMGTSFERPLSPTDLETYGRCPYQFFAARILKLEEIQDPEGDVAPLDVGQLFHHIMSAASGQIARKKRQWNV